MRINPLFWSSGVSQNIVAKQKASAELVEAFEWVEMDSNHRSYKAADLQSAPFGHSGIYPAFFLSLLSDSNQRPRDYKSRALAN